MHCGPRMARSKGSRAGPLASRDLCVKHSGCLISSDLPLWLGPCPVLWLGSDVPS